MLRSASESGGTVQHLDQNEVSSVNAAWESKQYARVLSLLEQDSNFPDKFNLGELNEEDEDQKNLKNFTQEKNRLHEWVKNDKLKEVKEYTLKKKFKYYVNDRNQSAAFTALSNRKFKIYAFLQSIGINLMKDESDEIRNLSELERQDLQEIMLSYFPKSENSPIYYLISKMKLKSENNLKQYIQDIFDDLKELNQIPGISVILKVVEHVENLDLVLDVDSENVQMVCPSASSTERGCTFHWTSTIYVAAGNKRKKEQVLGTTVHELTHLAMHAVFKNDCNPYFKLDHDGRGEFEKLTSRLKKLVLRKTGTPSETLTDAFLNYSDKNDHPSEFIARVPHILAQYTKGYEWLQNHASELFNYYNDKVIPECEKFIEQNFLSKPKSLIRSMNEREGEIIGIKYRSLFFKNVSKITSFLNNTNKKIFALITKCTWLGLLRILQGIYDIDYVESHDRFLVFKLDSLIKNIIDVEYLFRAEATEFLIIECPNVLGDNYKTLKGVEKVMKVVKAKKDKKIVFIMKDKEDENLMNVLKELKLTDAFAEENDDDFSLWDLIQESRCKILDKQVQFQEEKYILSDLIEINEDSLRSVNAGIIQDMLDNKEIKIGSKPLGMGSLEGAYADVFLKINTDALNQEIQSNRDIFIFCGKDKEKDTFPKYLNREIDESIIENLEKFDPYKKLNNKRIILTEEVADDDFTNFCTLNSKKKIYFLKESNESEPILLKFYNPDFYFKRQFKMYEKATAKKDGLDEEHIENLIKGEAELVSKIKNEKVVIFSDDPGMGKSTTLTKLYENELGTHWVIRINLKDHLSAIKKFESNIKIEQIAMFLTEIDSKLNNHMSKKLLEAAIDIHKKFRKNLLLCFDGFDELLDDQDRKKVTHLFRFIKNSTKCKIWITTRLHFKKNLENELSVFSINFVPIDDSLKIDFIKNYMKDRLKLILTKEKFHEIFEKEDQLQKGSKLWTCSQAFLDNARAAFQGDIERFMGTPLQLHLLLEGSVPSFQDWIEHSVKLNFSYFGNNFLQTYTKFFDRKYKIYYGKKNVLEGEPQDILKDRFENCHEVIAESLILNKELAEDIIKWKSSLLLLGITKYEGNNIQFVHFTFREYYFAQSFIKNHMHQLQEFYALFIEEKFQLVRSFINLHLKDSKTRIAFNKHKKEFHEMVLSSEQCLALYTAVRENNNNLFDFLMSLNFSQPEYFSILTETRHKGLLWHFAIKLKNDSALKCIIEIAKKYDLAQKLLGIVDRNQLTPFHIEILNKNDFAVNKIIETAAECNYVPQLLTDVDAKKNTAFHLAVLHGNEFALEKIVETASRYNFVDQLLCAANDNGLNAFHLAVLKKADLAAVTKMIEIASKHNLVQKLLSSVDANQSTAFHLAVLHENELTFDKIMETAQKHNSVQELLEAVNVDKRTALHSAISNKKNFAIQKIIDTADKYNFFLQLLSCSDANKYTAFHLAILYGNDFALGKIMEAASKHNLVQQLLDAVNVHQRTAFHLAISKKNDLAVNEILKMATQHNSVLHILKAIDASKFTAIQLAYLCGNKFALDKIKETASKHRFVQQFLDPAYVRRRKEFHSAIQEKNDSQVKEIIALATKENSLPQLLSPSGVLQCTALHLTVLHENGFAFNKIIETAQQHNFVQELLEAGNVDQHTAFQLAVEMKKDFAVKEIIEVASKYNLVSELLSCAVANKRTALHLAVEFENEFAFDKIMETAQNLNLVQELLEAGDIDQFTALHLAISNKRDFVVQKIIKAATKHSLVVTLLSAVEASNNYTALHLTIWYENEFAFNKIIEAAQKHNFVQKLLETGNINRYTALHLAVEWKKDFAVSKIIEVASKYNLVPQLLSAVNKYSSTAFYLAVNYENEFAFDQIMETAQQHNFVQELLEAGNVDQHTAFQLAVEMKKDFAVKEIIEVASKYNLVSELLSCAVANKRTALHLAVKFENEFAFDKIMETAQNLNLVQELLEAGDIDQYTAFHLAVQWKKDFAVQKIIEVATKHNLVVMILSAVEASRNNTALHLTIWYENEFAFNKIIEAAQKHNFVQKLLETGNINRYTALHLAVEWKKDFAVSKIIEVASKYNLVPQILSAVNVNQQTAFQLAVLRENEFVQTKILEAATKHNCSL